MLARQPARRLSQRGPGRFRFGYREVAQACARALHTVRSDLRLDAPIEVVATYVAKAIGQRAVKLTDAEVAKALGCNLAAWQARQPRVEVYRCPFPDCMALLLEPGLCGDHGGSRRPFAALGTDHIFVRIGDGYQPLCHAVVGGERVEHIDGNSWNCAIDNLQTPHTRRVWSYTYADLATLFGMSEDAVRQAASRKLLDPASLSSVCSLWALRQLS